MSKIGQDIIEGLTEALEIAKGERDPQRVYIPEEIDTRSLRKRLGMTQQAFADTFGFGLWTLRQWEQGRRVPTGATRAYLTVIRNDPDAVRAALARG
jgi:putative transcriptional regulator